MNTLTLFQKQISARFFAALTILSLLLTAFPAAFFLAEAASTGISVNNPTLTTEIYQKVNFVVSTIKDATDPSVGTYITVSDNGGAGSFFSGKINGECNSSSVDPDNQFAISDNKGVCYSNAVGDVYTITVQLFDITGPIGSPIDVEITVTVPAQNNAIEKKIDICHLNNGNGYIWQNVNLNSIGSGHGSNGVNMGDIIPPIPDSTIFHEGFNWDWGESWWNNECSDPNPNPEPIYGCMDKEAANYNPDATVNISVRCEYPEPSKCVNLLENGSFETPIADASAEAGGFWEVFASVTGWDISSDGLEIWNNMFGGASDGEQNIELDGNLSTTITQVVPTQVGATYELKFDFSPRPGQSLVENNINALVGGNILINAQGDGTSLSSTNWTTHSDTFVATSTLTSIAFADAGTTNTSYGGLADNAQLCLVSEPEPVATLVADKIICTNEADLPNWNTNQNSAPTITASTAAEWVTEHDSCELVDDWQFEWAKNGVSDPGDTLVGTAGANWHTFTGSTQVPSTNFTAGSFWVREVLQSGYIPFTHEATPNNADDVTAEMYCHTDGLNYDNLDRVDNPQAGESHYCVAWNVPEVQQCTVTAVSDTGTVVVENNTFAVETYDGNTAWTASIPGAKWIWETFQVQNPEATTTKTFHESFTVTDVQNAVLDVAVDNTYKVFINDVLIYDVTEPNNFKSFTQDNYNVASYLHDGENTLDFEVTNIPLKNSTYMTNPAGVLYKLVVNAETDCSLTTAPETYSIDGYKWSDTNGDGAWGEGESGIENWGIVVRPMSLEAVENVFVPAQDAVVTTANSLVAGRTYLVEAKGTYKFGVRTDYEADSEWSNRSDVYTDNPLLSHGWTIGELTYPSVVGLDLQINGQNIDWGTFNEDHLYKTIVVGGDAPLDFFILDSAYGDNTGGLNVSIYDVTDYLTHTDVDGHYSITVPVGDYQVVEVLQDGFTQTYPKNPSYYHVTVPDENSGYDFGNKPDEVPVVDVCPNLEGDQSEIPQGMEKDEEGQCIIVVPPPIDVCPNIDGVQTEIPAGMEKDEEGQCVQTPTDSEPEPETPVVIEERSRNSSSGGRRKVKPAPQVLGVATTAPTFCPLIIDHMQMGWDNSPLEVMKLQLFLNMFRNTFGGTENPVTGFFGPTTDANVKAFQEHYRSETLDPWFNQGIVPHNRATGFVYKTTKWKINEIVCPGYESVPSFAGEDLTTNTDID